MIVMRIPEKEKRENETEIIERSRWYWPRSFQDQ